MSWVRIWIHLVFTTKNREKVLTKEIRQKLIKHIKFNAREKEIFIEEINGFTDHIHCLVSLNKDISLSKTVQLIKGESSYWINKNKLFAEKFKWQDDYWAVSVSESNLNIVKNYIKEQENHHKYKPFKEEIEEFMKKYNLSFNKQ